MKPPKSLRKIEDLRVTRKTNAHVHTGGGEGWAVSYADMLMVLLSFFVMFFSLKDENPQTFDDQLKKISLSMKNISEQKQDEQRQGTERSDGHQQLEPSKVENKAPATGKDYSSISDALKIPGVSVVDEKSQLVIYLDDTAFSSASFQPGPDILSKVDEVLERLRPFEQLIQVTIVGHTDARRLVWRNIYLTDNFDLSSLRALRVLKHVIKKGFPENHASARAAASFERDTRSVSIVIQLLDVDKAPAANPVPQPASTALVDGKPPVHIAVTPAVTPKVTPAVTPAATPKPSVTPVPTAVPQGTPAAGIPTVLPKKNGGST